MTPPRVISASKEKLAALADERAKWQIRYSKKAEERRVQEGTIIREAFLRDYPNWEEKKNSFSDKERLIIELFYGLGGNKVLSLAKIGVILGKEKGSLPITRQRVQQIRDRVIRKLIRDLEGRQLS
jgi:DNA-directed RNA polymerase sigma subunit (sigma70/sigma32)